MNLNQNLRNLIIPGIFCLALLAGKSALGTQPTAPLSLTAGGTGRGTFSPNDNAKPLVIGKLYTIKATAAAGSQVSEWSAAGPTNFITNSAKVTFEMQEGLQLTCFFADVKAPTVTITTKKSTGSNSVVTIAGTAKDNVGVTAVWYQVGSGATALAATANDYTNWTGVAILAPGANVIHVYAQDAAGNVSPTNTVTLTYTGGLAPEALAGTTLQLTTVSNQTVRMSFNPGTYSFFGTGGADTGVGTYTYTVTEANTAALNTTFTAPPESVSDDNGQTNIITLVFTNDTAGTFSNTHGDSGSFILSGASSAVPAALSGYTLQGMDTDSNNFVFTNYYTNGVVYASNNSGDSSGVYTFQPYSPEAALEEEVYPNGTTNYVIMNFAVTPNSYFIESDATNGAMTQTGIFTVLGELGTKGYTAPETLAGDTFAVTQVNSRNQRSSFTMSLGTASFGKFTSDTNKNSGVGIYTYTRTGAKTANFYQVYQAPPVTATNEGGESVAFNFTSSRSATFTSPDSHGTISFSQPATTVPSSLVGRTLSGGDGGFSFQYNTFNGVKHSSGESGTYTYAVYGPQVAMVTLTLTDPADAGSTNYLEVWFSTAKGGSYVENDGSGGTYSGSFTMK